jgi:flagellar basal body rod protein FlgG
MAINLEEKDWHIDDTGALRQSSSVQNFALVKPASNADLEKQGENLFRSLSPTQPVPPTERRVAPNSLEMSGVNPTLEMTSMIEASRLFEANVSMMKTQDQMLNGLVNRVLKV